jgi:hypothetical protein
MSFKLRTHNSQLITIKRKPKDEAISGCNRKGAGTRLAVAVGSRSRKRLRTQDSELRT